MARQVYFDQVKSYTKSTPARLASMADALDNVDKNAIAGDVVECGVWRGGNIMLARLMSPKRVCWLFDTFDGMTEPDHDLDVKRSGERAIDRFNVKKAGGTKWDAVPLDEVQGYFRNLHLESGEIHFVVGPVEETLRQVIPERVAILRLDVDWYIPTKVSLEVLYPRIVDGGFLIVDDYGHWLGCQKAVDDYFQGNPPSHKDADYSCRVFHKC